MEIKTAIQIDATEVLNAAENVKLLISKLNEFKDANQSAVASIAEFISANQLNAQTIQATIKSLIQQAQTVPVVSEEYKQAIVSATNLKNALDLLTQTHRTLGNEFTNARSAVSQFLYIIQDSAYIFTDLRMGMVALSNNLPYLVQGFANLREQTGSTAGALTLFVQTLRGPLGVVAAVSLLVTILQGLVMVSRKTSQEVKDSADIMKKSWDDVSQSFDLFSMKVRALENELRTFRATQERAIEIDIEIRKGALERLNVVRAELRKLESELETMSRQRFAVDPTRFETLRNRISELRKEEEQLNKIVSEGSEAYRNYEKTINDIINATKNLSDEQLVNFLEKNKLTEAQVRATIKALEDKRKELAIGSIEYENNIKLSEKLNNVLKKISDSLKDIAVEDTIKKISEYVKSIETLALAGKISLDEAIAKLNEYKKQLLQLQSVKKSDIVISAKIQSEIENIEKFSEEILKKIKKQFEEKVDTILLKFKFDIITKEDAIKELENLKNEFKKSIEALPREIVPEKSELELIDIELFESNLQKIEDLSRSKFRELLSDLSKSAERVIELLENAVPTENLFSRLDEIKNRLKSLRESVKDEELKLQIDVVLKDIDEKVISAQLKPLEKKLEELRTIRALVELGYKIEIAEGVEELKDNLIKQINDLINKIPASEVELKYKAILLLETVKTEEIENKINEIRQRVSLIRQDVELNIITASEGIEKLKELRNELDSLSQEKEINVELKLEIERTKRAVERNINDLSISVEKIMTRGFDAMFDYLSYAWRKTWGENLSFFEAIIMSMVDELIRQLSRFAAQEFFSQMTSQKGGGLIGFITSIFSFIASLFTGGAMRMQEMPAVAAIPSSVVSVQPVLTGGFVTHEELRSFANYIGDVIDKRLSDIRFENKLNVETDWNKITTETTSFAGFRRKKVLIAKHI